VLAAALDQPLRVVVDLGLVLAADLERHRLAEGELRAAVET
jgi:hypothetical protein